MSEIPKGFCQCGCGGRTLIAKETSTRRGYRKGEPMNFIYGHNMRGRENKGTAAKKGSKNHSWKGGKGASNGYPTVHNPDHPRAHRGHVREHVLLAEKALAKALPPKAVVHHHTRDQLVICQDNTYHFFLHQRTRALHACGRAFWHKCVFCKNYDDPNNLIFPKKGNPFHRNCNVEYQRRRAKKCKSIK